MNRSLIFTVALVLATAASADDSIRITYQTDYPIPRYSSERSQIFISRDSSEIPTKPFQRNVDEYFSAIRKTLDASKVAPLWEPPRAIHADFVRVEIVLGQRKHTLVAGYGQHGPQISLEPSAADRRHLEALKTILRLTTDRMKSHLLGEGG